MRRNEFSVSDAAELKGLAARCEVGFLGIVDPEGFPRVIPLNFLLKDGCIYFHGALDGEKYNVLAADMKVTFSIIEPHAIIPSYWIAKDYACPATALYKSVFFRGKGLVVADVTEKAAALQAFMEKYQPEKNYRTISAEDSMYEKPLQKVAVFKIIPNRISVKFKFGQNFNESKRLDLIQKLEERNKPMDRETAIEIRKTLGIPEDKTVCPVAHGKSGL